MGQIVFNALVVLEYGPAKKLNPNYSPFLKNMDKKLN